jgi:hypothetical protein
MKSQRLIILGTAASNPYSGMAWMHCQMAAGLRRIGHDAYYFETTSAWPYDPLRQRKVNDSDYAVPYLTRLMASFGLGDCWAYRRSYDDGEWFGMGGGRAEELLATADAVFNVAGATQLNDIDPRPRRLVYHGTDPVIHELPYAAGDAGMRAFIDEHDDATTYGENIGTPQSPVPPLPRLRARTRQPVLLDLWQARPPARQVFTTCGNWKQAGLDVQFAGETYRWSKHHEFLKFIDLPGKVGWPIELAMTLQSRDPTTVHEREVVPSLGMDDDGHGLLKSNGWRITDASFTTDPWVYAQYVKGSRGEFTVARDLNVRLRSGWFSERSACYLAAGRPVITQDTGFGTVLPTGEGLFAFNMMDEALAAFEAVNADYDRHSRRARAIAEEYFRAETVLGTLLDQLGF